VKISYSLFIALVAALAGTLFGYGTAVMSGAILFISKEFSLSSAMNGLVVGIVLIGAFLGSLLTGWVGNLLGRKKLIMLGAALFILSSFWTASAFSISSLVAGRFFVGVAIGIASYIAPLYISEIAPPQHRGALVSLNQLAISGGILLSFIISYAFAGSGSWRPMLAIGAIPAALLFFGMFYLPDSPRWVLLHTGEVRAKKILQKIRGYREVAAELEEMKKSSREGVKNWKALFSRQLQGVLWIGFGLAIIQQVTGINTIFYYAPTILDRVGFQTATSAILATVGLGLVSFLFTIASLFMIDRLGRRTLLLAGLTGMSVGLALLTWSFRHSELAWVTLLCMCLYIVSFAVSLGPIVWLMIAEIYPFKVRSIGASLATAMNWLSNFLVTVTFLQLVGSIGISWTFFIYLVLSILSLLFVYFLIPETKGVSLEKIEAHVLSGKPLRKL
jgi:sugar porter (SP) family MFS transporter